MKIFLDANVLLDYLTGRQPFADDAEEVVEQCTREGNQGAFSALSACNIVYILRKIIGNAKAEELVKALTEIVGLLSLSREDVLSNLSTPHNDFEDSVQESCAVEWGADVIVTRDKAGFAGSKIPVKSPSEFLLASSSQ